MPPILPPRDGFLLLDREKFHNSFAADLPAEEAAFLADSQMPWGVDALGGAIAEPAWRTKPSWYLVATEDRMPPGPARRAMSERAGSTVVEVAGGHAIYASQPAAAAALIEQAVRRDQGVTSTAERGDPFLSAKRLSEVRLDGVRRGPSRRAGRQSGPGYRSQSHHGAVPSQRGPSAALRALPGKVARMMDNT